MIRAHFHLDAKRRITTFKLTGHAESGEYGQDIVCAAVSALTFATINGLDRLLKAKPKVKSDNQNGGFLEATKLGTDHDSQLLINTLLNGLLDIQERYPDNIEVKMFS